MARRVYDALIEYLYYDKTIPGCGSGDSEWIFKHRKGKGDDFHSLFMEGYEETGLRIVTINVWARDRRLIERYRDRFGFTFPMLAGNVKSLLAAYEVNYVPIVVFVRRDGTVHRIFHHYILKSDFKANLEEITQSR